MLFRLFLFSFIWHKSGVSISTAVLVTLVIQNPIISVGLNQRKSAPNLKSGACLSAAVHMTSIQLQKVTEAN